MFQVVMSITTDFNFVLKADMPDATMFFEVTDGLDKCNMGKFCQLGKDQTQISKVYIVNPVERISYRVSVFLDGDWPWPPLRF